MIKTSRQLKDLIRNKAKGDSDKSGLLIRNYGMERFLERVTLSKYMDNFILKGGMLAAAMVGLDNRATMDIDTSIRNLPLDMEHAKKIVEEIVGGKNRRQYPLWRSRISQTLWTKRSTAVCAISLWAYPLETVLAEKIETVLSRGVLNTRLRDFYDLYILQQTELQINRTTLAAGITWKTVMNAIRALCDSCIS